MNCVVANFSIIFWVLDAPNNTKILDCPSGASSFVAEAKNR